MNKDNQSCCGMGCHPAPVTPRIDRDVFPADTFRIIMSKFDEPSVAQIENCAKQRVTDFLLTKPNDQEIYDFLVKFRQEEHGSISSFISTLCNVSEYYERPK